MTGYGGFGTPGGREGSLNWWKDVVNKMKGETTDVPTTTVATTTEPEPATKEGCEPDESHSHCHWSDPRTGYPEGYILPPARGHNRYQSFLLVVLIIQQWFAGYYCSGQPADQSTTK